MFISLLRGFAKCTNMYINRSLVLSNLYFLSSIVHSTPTFVPWNTNSSILKMFEKIRAVRKRGINISHVFFLSRYCNLLCRSTFYYASVMCSENIRRFRNRIFASTIIFLRSRFLEVL